MEALIGEVTLDKKRRLALGRIVKEKEISSFDIYRTENGYLLKPKVSIPADEAWIFKNPEVKRRLAKGLSQKAAHHLGSFAKYAGLK